MRILMTSDTVGGVWSYAIELARALAPHGVETTLATMGRLPTPDQCRAAAAVPGLDLRSSRFQLEWMDDPWDDIERAGDWLLELAEATRPDLVHLNGYAHGVLPFRAPVLVVGHSCVCTWWRAVIGEDAPERYRRYQQAVSRGLHAADAVVTPTRAFLEALEDVYLGPFRRWRVIHNAIDLRHYAAGRKEPFVLAAGRLWDPAKNLALLDAVAERVSWPIRVAGDATPPEGSWDVRTRHVELLGRLPREALAVCMSRASILCHPALYEPFGLVPVEAAASGAALVLSDIPTLREVWGDAALYVRPDEPDAVAQAVQFLVDHPSERERLARRAARRVARYDGVDQVRSYLELYRELVENPSDVDRAASRRGGATQEVSS